jgi:1,4-alpha-glucan branching enzyme
MIHKRPSAHFGFVRVTFELPSCVWADRISVSGTFNNWEETGIPLVQSRDGVWRATVELPVGQRHEFRYMIDGRWQTDYHADGFTDNIHGSHNSVIDLEWPATVTERQPSKVTDSQPSVAAHLPAPKEGTVRGINGERSPAEMPRMRPRVAAA